MREPAGTEELDAGAEAEARRLLGAAFETAPARTWLAAGWVTAAGPNGAAPSAGEPLGRVRKRAARQRRRRVLVPAGAVALAAVAGGVTAGAVTGGNAAQTPGALKAVTAALVKTSAQSFTFTLTTTQRRSGTGIPLRSEHTTGEFDPASGTGEEEFLMSSGPSQQIRFIGGYMYATVFPQSPFGHGKKWVKGRALRLPARELPSMIAKGFIDDEPVNPADLLDLLKSAGMVREEGPASGPGWTGTSYGFTVNLPQGLVRNLHMSVGGTVSVDSSGRVRKLVTVSQIGPGSKAGPVKTTETLTFGGFGTPVSVTAPPASQVYDAGNMQFLYAIG